MLELGKYAGAVLSAYGAGLGLLALLVAGTWRQSLVARRALDAAEARQVKHGKN